MKVVGGVDCGVGGGGRCGGRGGGGGSGDGSGSGGDVRYGPTIHHWCDHMHWIIQCSILCSVRWDCMEGNNKGYHTSYVSFIPNDSHFTLLCNSNEVRGLLNLVHLIQSFSQSHCFNSSCAPNDLYITHNAAQVG